MTYALDTNTISYAIQADVRVKNRIREALAEKHNLVIPPITYYEIRRGFKHKTAPKKEKSFTNLCRLYSIGEMSISAWECAADIYARSRRMGNPTGDADILIAAFCIVNGYTLVTNNVKHFGWIDGLQWIDWVN